MECTTEALAGSPTLQALNVLDTFSRECPSICRELGLNQNAGDFIRTKQLLTDLSETGGTVLLLFTEEPQRI